jgi:hypothetical protein
MQAQHLAHLGHFVKQQPTANPAIAMYSAMAPKRKVMPEATLPIISPELLFAMTAISLAKSPPKTNRRIPGT